MVAQESTSVRGAPPRAAGHRAAGAFLPALPRGQSPRTVAHSPRLVGDTASLSASSSLGFSAPGGSSVLPPALDAALDEHLASLALEDWRHAHRELPVQRAAFESPVVRCEARLRKLDQLSSRLKQPNEVIVGTAYDILRSAAETLPPGPRAAFEQLVTHVEDAIYSDEPSPTDVAGLVEVLDHPVDRLPHFLVAKRQQANLDAKEQRWKEMQEYVDTYLEQHRHMVSVMKMFHADEQRSLQHWLLAYWKTTFRSRRLKIRRMADLVLSAPMDPGVPLACWKLYVSERRLEKAKKECEVVDKKASCSANRITEVETENDSKQRELQKVLEAAASLKVQCVQEQRERERLQQQWDLARPELLMSVMAQTLQFFFGIIMRVAHFSSLELRQRFAGKDISPLVVGFPAGVSLQGMMLEEVLVRWVNRALASARASAQEQLMKKSVTHSDRSLLLSIKSVTDVRNLSRDLSDSSALCALFAVLSSRRDGKPLAPKDLWPVQERDLELRASLVCGLLASLGQTRKARCLLDPQAIASGSSENTSVFLACCFLQDPMLDDIPKAVDASGRAMLKQQLEDVIAKIEEHAAGAAFEYPEDPTPLLADGDMQSLSTTSAEQLLLRWTNVQISTVYHRPIENFSSDLQDGLAIGHLLSVVAPEVLQQPLAAEFEARLDQIVVAASRCTESDLLTPAVIIDGQSDILACFLAQLFLSRPNLGAKPDSLLAMHLKLLERLCRNGLAALEAPSGSNSQVMEICMELEANWSEFLLAAQTVQEANTAMEATYERLRTFLGDTLVHRAQGQPRVMLDAKEAREFAVYTALQQERLVAIFTKESLDAGLVGRLEEILRKNFRLVRDIYQYYMSSSGNTIGVTLEGLLKLYQDCKLRSKDLVPHHLEVLFYDQVDSSLSNDRALTPQGFVEVLLQLASLRFRSQSDMLDDQLCFLLDQHLKPLACQDTDSIFQTIAYEPKVRQALDDNAKELRTVFKLYASLDASSPEAMQKATTMNVKEFTLLLSHCDMLDESLTEEVTEEIFDGIQDSATNQTCDEQGMGDDDELAFTEFLDGIVAIAAYKFPDPFTPFHKRVTAFVMQLFGALRKYWSRKRINPQVDVLLNVLQKRLR